MRFKKVKNRLKKFPYISWLIISQIFLAITFFSYQCDWEKYSPVNIKKIVQKDFNKRQAKVYTLYHTGYFNAYNDINSSKPIDDLDFYWFIFQNNKVINWSSNSISLTSEIRNNPQSFKKGKIINQEGSVYYIRYWPLTDVIFQKDKKIIDNYVITCIPLFYNNSYNNFELGSYFSADEKIPQYVKFSEIAEDEFSIPILNASKEIAFYLVPDAPRQNFFTASFQTILCGLLFFIFLCCYIHLISVSISKRFNRPLLGLIFIVGLITTVILIRNWFGLPYGFNNLSIFSSNILAAHKLLHSLGDLLLFIFFDSWIILYVFYNIKLERKDGLKLTLLNRFSLLIYFAVIIFAIYFFHSDRIYSLIIDSRISYDTSNFNQISIYSFVGFFGLSLIAVNHIILLNFLSKFSILVYNNRLFKYILFTFLSLVCIFIIGDRDIDSFYYAILVISIICFFLIDFYGMPLKGYFSQENYNPSASIYVWVIMLCSIISLEILYFSNIKEKENRKILVNKIEQNDAALIPSSFQEFKKNVISDSIISNAVSSKNKASLSLLFSLYRDYFNLPFGSYDLDFFHFNSKGEPMNVEDSLKLSRIKIFDPFLDISSFEEMHSFYGMNNDLAYWGMVPILKTPSSKDTLGYLGVYLKPEELLLKAYSPLVGSFALEGNSTLNYSYAVYKDFKLQKHEGDYVFSIDMPSLKNKGISEYWFENGWKDSKLYYRTNEGGLIIIVHKYHIISNFMSLFSYVLSILFAFWIFVAFIRMLIWLRNKILNKDNRFIYFSIHSKINLSILITILICFFVLTGLAIPFLKDRYKEIQTRNLKILAYSFYQSIQEGIREQNIQSFSELNKTNYQYLNFVLEEVKGDLIANLNLYNSQGELIAITPVDLMSLKAPNRMINREAYIRLKSGQYSDLIIDEQIGNLHYQSLYLALKNKDDIILGYIYIPFYLSNVALIGEVSNMIAKLITIYLIIILLAGFAAYFISNNFIKSFKLLTQQFKSVQLKHNELLYWPHKDELGVLVNEYNKMIIKVEKMANQLASQERENAWRDLAKQIAHEIKNPLTPMKLNVQYLQNVIKDDESNHAELTKKVTKRLIEEIENLNFIASEFANFAKMPEPNVETIDVVKSLQSILDLFYNQNEEIQLSFMPPDENPHIIIDKSYFRRIFTNLIKNAIQAIPDGRKGKVELKIHLNQDKIIILVKDNGKGIEENMKEKMFIPYFTTKSSGTGIGLSMTKKMVESSHGKIWFDSKVEEGTIFYIQFPRVIM